MIQNFLLFLDDNLVNNTFDIIWDFLMDTGQGNVVETREPDVRSSEFRTQSWTQTIRKKMGKVKYIEYLEISKVDKMTLDM